MSYVTSEKLTLVRHKPGLVRFRGFEMPDAHVMKETRTHIALKIPGHAYWNGRGCERGFKRTEIVVLEKIKGTDDTWSPVIDFELTKERKL
jgi:hypothetical protein